MHVRLPARPRRLAVVAAATFGLVVSATASPAFAAGNHHADAHGAAARPATYLALGDSVPFGYYALQVSKNDPTYLDQYAALYGDPNHFVGYPELLAQEEHLRLLNASCPGETTDSFIDPTAQSNGCENSVNPVPGGQPVPGGYRDHFPLHVNYTGSQLDYAIDTLQDKRNNVQLVTLMVGANDTFVCQKTTADACTSTEEIATVTQHVKANLDRILSALRKQAHYSGRIVVVNYYALDYTSPTLPGTVALDQAMNAAAADFHASVASGFFAYLPIAFARGGGDSIKAGLVRPNDVHPTPFGQWVLSEAVERALPR